MAKKSLFILLIILLIASFFRLWKLNKIPPGLYPDVAINGNEAFFSLKNRDFKVFYPENYGREGLWMWLIAFSFSICGVSIWSIRIVSAVFGILTVFGLYLLAKELFSSLEFKVYGLDSEGVALLSSFFLATSFWHTNFSRIGFRAILLPFVLVFYFYFLIRGFKTKKFFNFIISGIFFGLGFYTYTSFRMAVLILPFIFVPFWFIFKKENCQKKYLLLVACFLIATFFVALPIGIYFLKNPQDFISRATPITIFNAENPLKEFFKSLILHLAMFNFYGDPNWRHNFSGKPELFWPVGILFLIGIFISIKESISSIKNKNLSLATYNLLLVSWFFVMLLPGTLTREGIPHSLRVVGVIPVVFIFAGLGGVKVYQFLENNVKSKKLLFSACILFLFAIFLFEFNKYFFVWAKREEVKSEFTSEYLEMGNYLNSLPEDFEKYVIANRSGVPVSWANGIPMSAQSIMFLEISKYKEIKSNYLLPDNLNQIKIEKGGVILPIIFDENIFEYLKEKFPKGQIKKINNFFSYEIR